MRCFNDVKNIPRHSMIQWSCLKGQCWKNGVKGFGNFPWIYEE